eukprot:12402776-Karenia_brevis.AAC.1
MEIDKYTTEQLIDVPLQKQIEISKTPAAQPAAAAAAPAAAEAPRAPAGSTQGPRPSRGGSRGVSLPRYSQEDVLKGVNMNEEGKRRLIQTCRTHESRVQTMKVGDEIQWWIQSIYVSKDKGGKVWTKDTDGGSG